MATLARCRFDLTQHARGLQRLQRPVMSFKNHGGCGCGVADLLLVHSQCLPPPTVFIGARDDLGAVGSKSQLFGRI
jgi:hypothetical protein